MKPSQNCIDLIKKFEGFRADAYLCSAGVATIGWGSTRWADGKKVVMGQKISMADADKLLTIDVERRAAAMPPLNVNQNQFDALISFAYNLGMGALLQSTLLKKVRINPNDPTIKDEFQKWVKASGKVLKGLQRRREAEAKLYFTI